MPTLVAVNQAAVIETHSWATVSVEVSANTNCTLVFEVSQNGSVWYSVSANSPSTGATVTGVSVGATGVWVASVAGFAQFRARVSVIGATPTCAVELCIAERMNPTATPSGSGALPTGASTAALQTSGNASLTSIDGKTAALGTALMAASSPVTVATNDVVSTNLVTIGARTPALGTAVMTGSSPVTIATNDVLVSPIAAVGATAPTSASAVGGIGGTPGVSAPTAVTAGQLVRLWQTLKGALVTRLTGPDDLDLFPSSAAPADAVTNTELTPSIRSRLIGFNGTTWDRLRVGVTGAVSAVTGWTNVLPGAQYLGTNPTMTEAQFTTLLTTISGFLKVSMGDTIEGENSSDHVLHVMPKAMTSNTGSWTSYNSTATLVGTAGISVKAAAGRLASIRATSTNTTVQHYLLLCDKASAPVANDVAVASVAIPALTAASIATTGVLDFAAAGGKYFSLGVAYAISTTPQKVTLAGALEFAVQAEYA